MESVQPGMQPQDELTALFSQNLTLSQGSQTGPPDIQRGPDPTGDSPLGRNFAYSITQHYHHSAHVPQPPSGSPELPAPGVLQRPLSQPADSLSSDTVLRIHGIDPSTLTPSQVHLFRIADRPQQRRLLELWSICPPENGASIPALAWSSTTMEQEEQLARLRYEQTQQHEQQQQQQQQQWREQAETYMDGAPMQGSNGRWNSQPSPESEPYMTSGYDELMRREKERDMMRSRQHIYNPATDPVYLGPDFARQQQQIDLATQYGAFEQLRAAPQTDAMDVM